jgi:2-keto-3-deoxy-L-rhamnonate aldolase RhmA
VGVRMTRSVEIAKAMAVAGFDWLFLDMEHGVMSLEACAQIVLLLSGASCGACDFSDCNRCHLAEPKVC